MENLTKVLTNAINDSYLPNNLHTLDERWFEDEIELIIGIILMLATSAGIVQNLCIMGMFCNMPDGPNSRINSILMSLALSDFLMAFVGGTMFTSSSFAHKWIYAHSGCVFYGFLMFVTGCVDITHLMVIAIDRAYAITSPVNYSKSNNPRTTACTIFLAWFYGSIWAVLPLFGFQEYTYEGRISCSINWLSRKPKDIAYVILIACTCYVIPLVVMFSCYGYFYVKVKLVRSQVLAQQTYSSSGSIAKIDKHLALTLFLTMAVCMLAWTPYLIACLWPLLGDVTSLPIATKAIPAVFAKFSMAINPILYIGTNKKHRYRMKRYLVLSKNVEPIG